MDETDFEGRLANHLARGELTQEEHDSALAAARAATDPDSDVSRAVALGDQVMVMHLAFLRSPEMRAALEEYARANHASLWNAFDAACHKHFLCDPWEYILLRLDQGVELVKRLAGVRSV